jgi:hypothetical protein
VLEVCRSCTLNLSLAAPASGYVRHPCGFIEPCLRSSGWILSTPPALMVRVILSHKAGRSHDIGDTTEVRTNYEPQSDAATGGMLASATGMAAASSFGPVFIGTIGFRALARAVVTRNVETLCGILRNLVPNRPHRDAKQTRRQGSVPVSMSEGF